MDWTLFHAVNASVATRDWLEDAVTVGSGPLVVALAVVTVGMWFAATPNGDARWKHATVAALTSASLALLVNQAIGHLWERPRPFVAHAASTHLLAGPSLDPSFPSDHAAAAFAIAVAVLAFSRRLGVLLLVAAAAIAVSRVALGLHYPSDVVAGAAVGMLAAQVVVHAGMPGVRAAARVASVVSDPVVRPVRNAVSRSRR
jgi:undecaprenyl-diphosphatase